MANSFEIKGSEFYLNGNPFKIYSGAMHYFRTLPEYWEDRLLKLKLAGFNTVETYVCWNLHEPEKGVFDFSGMMMTELKNRFADFLDKNEDNMLKCEYFLPFVVDDLLKEGKISVKVMDTTEKWHGVTYKEDKQAVVDAIRQKITDGVYPENLW